MRVPLPLFLILSAALLPGTAPGASALEEGAPAASRGLRLEEMRDAAILWGGEYYILLRSHFFVRHIPVEGYPLSDKESNLRQELFFSYGVLGGRADLSAAFDIYGRWLRPEGGVDREPPPATSTGDIGDSRLGLRVGLPSPARRLRVAVETFLSLPTGNQEKSFSSYKTDAGALIGLSWREERFRGHLQAGYRLNRNEEEGVLLYPLFYPKVPDGKDDTSNDAYILRAGVEFISPRADLYAELYADQLLNLQDRIDFRENPLQFIPGFRLRLRRGWYFSGTMGIGLSRSGEGGRSVEGFEQSAEVLYPDWTASLGIHVFSTIGADDGDDDGVDDPFDRCPNAPEDYDGYRDDDGCPDIDNDRDGILDAWDWAPNDPEDLDGFEDEDGAPEYDNDLDGVPDVEDRCPDLPEDMDGDRDDDGCPDDDLPAGSGETLPEAVPEGAGEPEGLFERVSGGGERHSHFFYADFLDTCLGPC